MATQPRPAGKTARTGLRLVTPDLQTGSETHRNREKLTAADVEIYVDNRPEAGYNSRWFVRHCIRWWYFWLARILFRKRLCHWLFANTSNHARTVVRYSKSYRALKQLYNWDRPKDEIPEMLRVPPEKHWYNHLLAWWWETVLVYGEGTRNRLRQVKMLTRDKITETPASTPLRFLSIGSGSCQGILEVMAEMKRREPSRLFTLYALDKSASARKECQTLARALGLPPESVKTISCDVREIADVQAAINGDAHFDLIEVVGFSEYRDAVWLRQLAALLHGYLTPKGVLLFNNAQPNVEGWFTIHVAGWPLDLKKPRVLAEILVDGGFDPNNVRVIGEPTKTFWMAVGTKNAA